jgi:hypothetical protein
MVMIDDDDDELVQLYMGEHEWLDGQGGHIVSPFEL